MRFSIIFLILAFFTSFNSYSQNNYLESKRCKIILKLIQWNENTYLKKRVKIGCTEKRLRDMFYTSFFNIVPGVKVEVVVIEKIKDMEDCHIVCFSRRNNWNNKLMSLKDRLRRKKILIITDNIDYVEKGYADISIAFVSNQGILGMNLEKIKNSLMRYTFSTFLKMKRINLVKSFILF